MMRSSRPRFRAATSTASHTAPASTSMSSARSVKDGDRLDLHQKARFGQALYHYQRAGWVGRLGKEFVARLADEWPVRPVGDIRRRFGQVPRSCPVVAQNSDDVAPRLPRLRFGVA